MHILAITQYSSPVKPCLCAFYLEGGGGWKGYIPFHSKGYGLTTGSDRDILQLYEHTFVHIITHRLSVGLVIR